MNRTSPQTAPDNAAARAFPPAPAPVAFWRRMAAATYDGVLVAGLWFLATALLLPFTDGKAVPPGTVWFPLYLIGWAMAFFCGFWLHGGQTLGMRAWGIRVVGEHGQLLGAGQAALRFLAAVLSWACAGAGFWWALARRDRRTWHDLLSRSRLERLR